MRMCICQGGIQTPEHVLCSCPLVQELRHLHGFKNQTVAVIMNGKDYGRQYIDLFM